MLYKHLQFDVPTYTHSKKLWMHMSTENKYISYFP